MRSCANTFSLFSACVFLLCLQTGSAFDYFYFVRRLSTRDSSIVDPDAGGWKIHGLWPNYSDGTWDSFCDPTATFDLSLISDLVEDLKAVWRGFGNMTDEDLWAHEWLKHGTCSYPYVANEVDYFEKGLKLQRKYDLEYIFKSAGIYPSHSHIYSSKEIEDAIAKATGATPRIICSKTDPVMITDVWMCVTKDLVPFDCTDRTADRCHGLMFPPYESGYGNWM